MKKVLITGITGFTGRYLAPKLAAAGYQVHGTVHGDRSPSAPPPGQFHQLDIADAEAVARLISELRPDKVVHLAAISFVAHSDVAEMYRANVLGTRNLLDALANCSTRPTAVLLASSANVYGRPRENIIDETAPTAPANDYGVTKAAAELCASLYSTRLPLIVVRPFNYTGVGQSDQFLVPKIVAHVLSRAAAIELGNVDVARDFSDVRTIVDAYARLLEAPEAIGGTFNVCSGRAISLRDLIDLAGRISGQRLEVHVSPALVRPDEPKAVRGSAARLEKVIGQLATRPIEETLRWMLG